MNKKQQTVLKKLLNMYSELYAHDNLFNKNLFFGTPEEISQLFSSELADTVSLAEYTSSSIRDDVRALKTAEHTSSSIRDDVQGLKTAEQVREFIANLELLDGQHETLTENKAATDLTIAEYKYIYSVLYQTPIKGKIKKETLINYIVKYFKGIDRAQALKP